MRRKEPAELLCCIAEAFAAVQYPGDDRLVTSTWGSDHADRIQASDKGQRRCVAAILDFLEQQTKPSRAEAQHISRARVALKA